MPEVATESQVTDPKWEERVRIFGRFVLVRKCFNDHIRGDDGDVLIHLPDKVADWTNWAEVLKVGKSCREFCQEDIGWFVRCPEWGDGMHPLGHDYWMIDERLIDKADKRKTAPDLVPCVVKP